MQPVLLRLLAFLEIVRTGIRPPFGSEIHQTFWISADKNGRPLTHLELCGNLPLEY